MTDTTKYGPGNPHPLSQVKTELIWEGKYDEYGTRREVDVAGCVMPLQKVESIDEPRQRAEEQGTLALWQSKAGAVRENTGEYSSWRNRLIWGDNKLVLASMLAEFKGKVDLIYIDPPFDVGADFTMSVPVGDDKGTLAKEQSALEMVAYRDTWGRGTDSYLHMLYERFAIMSQLLSPSGSIYVHLGPNISHYVKPILDEVFTSAHYHSEIVWRRSNSHNKLTDQYGPIHDVILFYSKGDAFVFHPGKRPFSRKYIEERFKYRDHRGVYQPNYLTGPGTRRGDSGKPWHGYDPTRVNRHWAIPSTSIALLERDVTGMSCQEILDALLDADLLVIPKKSGGQPMYKQYLTEGVPYQDIWAYQPNTQGVQYNSDECIDEDVKWLEQEEEKLGYNTQKPEGLLARIIETSTDSGALVADFFCGSGTTGAVAEKMGRRWIMCDLGRYSIHTSRKRMIEIQRKLYEAGKPYRAFDVYNLGRYERQWWQKERLAGMEEEHRRIVLAFYRAEPLTGATSALLHGRKGSALLHVDGIDSILTLDELKPIAEAVHAAGAKEVHCLAWEFEMELKRNAEALEHEHGVKIRLIRIPREVMEKNRRPGVDQVPFFEMATLAAETVIKIEGGVRIADVKLTNFLPSLSEVSSKELEALQERAVKSGFDFIDFWAVDFDHKDGQPFKHHWQDYRLRKDRSLKLESDCGHRYEDNATHRICVKVIDTFGCDTSILLDVPGGKGSK